MTKQATFEAFARQYAERGMSHSALQIPVVLEFALACWIEATRVERERCIATARRWGGTHEPHVTVNARNAAYKIAQAIGVSHED